MRAFGFAESDLAPSLFETGNTIKFGIGPVQIDPLNEIGGIHFFEAVQNTVGGTDAGIPTVWIGREVLIENKRASHRPVDLADLEKRRP